MKVLFATDNSPHATIAAKFLRRLKFQEPLDVILLSVSALPEGTNAEFIEPWFADWLAKEEEYVEDHQVKLQRLLSDHTASLKSLHRNGHAAQIILQEAENNQVDLIVMGARGHSLLDRILIGSISDQVATHATCSVLVVRPPEKNVATERSNVKIAFAYDGSAPACEAVNELLDLGWDKETEVRLISVSPIYDYGVGDGFAVSALANEQEAFQAVCEAGEKAAAKIATVLPKTQTVVERKHHVGDAIVTTAKETQSDFVVIGDAGHGLMHDWLLGSTSKYVLRHAGCSVWISRHHRTPHDSQTTNKETSSIG